VLQTPGHANCGFRVFRVRLLQSRMPGSTNLYVQVSRAALPGLIVRVPEHCHYTHLSPFSSAR